MYTYMQQQECIQHYNIQEVPEHPVALLYGLSGKAEYVVKGFESAHELNLETEALGKIKALNLPNVKTVNFIHADKIIDQDISYWFITETVAPGDVLADYVNPEKPLTFNQLRTAVQALASATTQLHASEAANLAVEGQTTDYFVLGYFNLEKLKRYGLYEEYQTHLKFYKNLMNQVKIHLVNPSFSHGDLQWCNVFYDASNNDIVLIDVQTFQEYSGSVDSAMKDIKFSQTSLWYCYLAGLLSKTERDLLHFDFFSTYAPRVSTAPNDTVRDLFWQASCLMVYLDYSLDILDDEDEEEFSNSLLLEKIHEIFHDFTQLEEH